MKPIEVDPASDEGNTHQHSWQTNTKKPRKRNILCTHTLHSSVPHCNRVIQCRDASWKQVEGALARNRRHFQLTVERVPNFSLISKPKIQSFTISFLVGWCHVRVGLNDLRSNRMRFDLFRVVYFIFDFASVVSPGGDNCQPDSRRPSVVESAVSRKQFKFQPQYRVKCREFRGRFADETCSLHFLQTFRSISQENLTTG